MANYSFQVALHSNTGLPEDDVVNVLYYSINAPDTVVGQMDEVAAAYQGLVGLYIADVAGITIKAYADAVGQPVEAKDYAASSGPGTGPGEVAVCLSYASVDDPEASTGRQRGRIYIGKIVGTYTGDPRPASALRNRILDFGESLAAVGTASNTTWMMHSKRDNAFRKIESIWTDDAWDTQRRRGLAPTLRVTRDVQ